MTDCKTFWGVKHYWTRWIVTENGTISRGKDAVIGNYIKQKRTCEKCGMIELRIEKTTI